MRAKAKTTNNRNIYTERRMMKREKFCRGSKIKKRKGGNRK